MGGMGGTGGMGGMGGSQLASAGMPSWCALVARDEQIEVWLAEREGDGVAAALAAAAARLRGVARERHERFVDEAAREHFLLARALVAARFGEGVELAGSEGEAPRLCGAEWPVSVAHAGGAAALAVARRGRVGVDVERLREVSEALAAAALGREELVADGGVGEEERAWRFFRRWTAKEARMKLFGEGLRLPPRALRVDLVRDVVVEVGSERCWPFAWAQRGRLIVSWMLAESD